jgi:ribosomal protein S18 acetylase RimI-like enzyme
MAELSAADVSAVVVRAATPDDWPEIWPMIHDVAREGRTFANDPRLSESQARDDWMTPDPGRVVVACGTDGSVLAVANMYANRPGPGAHVASGSLIVAEAARGRGVGDRLVSDLLAWCRGRGFAAVQFNAVVDTNTTAIRLYQRHGFITLGIAPGAFEHPERGRVGLRIMWRDLSDDA